MSFTQSRFESFVTDRTVAEVESCFRMVNVRKKLADDKISVKEAFAEIDKESVLLDSVVQSLRDYHDVETEEVA